MTTHLPEQFEFNPNDETPIPPDIKAFVQSLDIDDQGWWFWQTVVCRAMIAERQRCVEIGRSWRKTCIELGQEKEATAIEDVISDIIDVPLEERFGEPDVAITTEDHIDNLRLLLKR